MFLQQFLRQLVTVSQTEKSTYEQAIHHHSLPLPTSILLSRASDLQCHIFKLFFKFCLLSASGSAVDTHPNKKHGRRIPTTHVVVNGLKSYYLGKELSVVENGD